MVIRVPLKRATTDKKKHSITVVRTCHVRVTSLEPLIPLSASDHPFRIGVRVVGERALRSDLFRIGKETAPIRLDLLFLLDYHHHLK